MFVADITRIMSIILSNLLEDIKPVFDVLKDLVQDVNLTFTETRMEINAVDGEKMVFLAVTFDHLNYYKNEFGETIHIGVYAPFIYKAIKTGKRGDILEFVVTKNANNEYILTVNVQSNGYTRTTTTVPSIMMPVEHFERDVPGTFVGIDARDLWMACRDLSSINRLATLTTPNLTLTAEHAMGTYKADLTRFLKDPVPVMAMSSVTFHVKILMRLCKMKLVDTIALNVSNLEPLSINFSHRIGAFYARIATVNDYLPNPL